MSTDVPLLNDYKKKFVRHRLLQTFLGGLRLAGVPWYTLPVQIVIFLFPLGAVVPYYYVLVDENVKLIRSLVLAAVIGKNRKVFSFTYFFLQIVWNSLFVIYNCGV